MGVVFNSLIIRAGAPSDRIELDLELSKQHKMLSQRNIPQIYLIRTSG